MRKLLIILTFFLSSHLKGIVSIEADASAFFPTNHTVRNVYGNVWQNYGITFDHIQPFSGTFQPISFFGQVNYLFSHGCSEGGNQPTHIQLVPITFGLKWIQNIHNNVELYMGIAPRYYFMAIDNNSSYVPNHQNNNGCGAYITAGSFFYPIKNCMINLFLDYSYMKFKAPCSTSYYESFSTNVSGFSLGGGIGWHF
jgi:hypothetical protein